MLKKIVIIGPESTGKSTLCEQLAQHYDSIWCPEFAREYLLTNGTKYTFDDLLTIAKGQLALEDEYATMTVNRQSSIVNEKIPENSRLTIHDSRPLFIDTDMYVMKVWCEFVFEKCHRFILDKIIERKYDLYLLCNIDLPWTEDKLREYPDIQSRQQLYNMYEDIMVNQNVPWVNISGNYEERLGKAIDAVDILISQEDRKTGSRKTDR
jgi:NadR type nicotinamide-nucleotide adenylyltransferase